MFREKTGSRLGTANRIAMVLLVLSVLMGCSSSAGEIAAGEEVPFEEIHNQVQDAIVQCMGDQGFNYEPVPYGQATGTVGGTLFLSDAPIGYFGSYSAFGIEFGGADRAPDDFTEDQVLAYYTALGGPRDLESQDDAAPGGCQAEAAKLEALLWEETPFARFGNGAYVDFEEELRSSDEWIRLSESWFACMQEAGVTPPSNDPADAALLATFEYGARADEALARDVDAGLTVDIAKQSVSPETFLELVGGFPELNAVFQDELEAVAIDRDCRVVDADLQQRVDELSVAYFGVPWKTLAPEPQGDS